MDEAQTRLIVMLTHHDRTVENAPEVFEACRGTGAEYWGMKEEGLPPERMRALYRRMQECGKKTALEVVAYTEAEGLLLRPGEVFSFWHTVGKVTRRKGYRGGRVIVRNHLTADIGGGVWQPSHPPDGPGPHRPPPVAEVHSPPRAPGPGGGPPVPFSAGTSVCYNYVDFRFRNDTDQTVQLMAWCEEEELYVQLRSERPFPWAYEIVEEDHHFQKEGADYYRVSKIYRRVTERATGRLVRKDLILDNHSQVMFDPALIPPELLRP